MLRVALGAAVAVALVNFLWGIEGLSYFGDEVFSIGVAGEPLVDPMFDRLKATEVAPPVYYVLLHGWIELTGADRELGLRLPSVLVSLLLVASVYHLALAIGRRRSAMVAALLVALSPLVATFAQQVRAYALTELLVALAALAAIVASRGGPRARLLGWTATGLCIAAVWTHYTALPVVAAIVMWSALTARDAVRERVARPVVVALGTLLLAPLASEHFARGSEDQAGAALSLRTVLEVLATPFDGRDVAPMALVAAGACVMTLAVALHTPALGGFSQADPRVLLLACGAGPPLLLVLLALGGKDVLWSATQRSQRPSSPC